MFNLDKFIPDSVTFRPVSMFVPDIEANKGTLTKERFRKRKSGSSVGVSDRNSNPDTYGASHSELDYFTTTTLREWI